MNTEIKANETEGMGAASELSAGLERMVREAGWSGIYTQWTSPTERESMTVPVTPEQVARFAELVVAAERERVLDGIDECPGLTMAQDKWLSDMVRSNAELTGADRRPG